jgi:phospholipid-binding lipoprotein MlaA
MLFQFSMGASNADAVRMRGRVRTLIASACLCAAAGCATPPESDPWEKLNRKTFAFNVAVDKYAYEPAAKAWDKVLPDFVETGIGNLFDHANRPFVLLHNLLQGKPAAAGEDLVRLIANTIFGFGGLVDVASMDGMPEHDEDWGQTLAVWGVESGPYLELPFFGPSTPRSAVGLAADTFGAPYSYFIPFYASATVTATRLLNTRAHYLDQLAQERRDAFDWYVFRRDAYLQNLKNRVNDGAVMASEEENDLYYYDDFEDDEYDEDDEEVNDAD